MASTLSAEKILDHHHIRVTESRLDVLEVFTKRNSALSQPDLENALGKDYDRVTLYRTISLFQEKGIIHKVLDDSGASRFALCSEACLEQDHQHSHEHVHFKCTKCSMTTCLDHVHIPGISLPEGYSTTETNLLILGVCRECNLG